MWHKPCRTFNPWCLCIKTRCLSVSLSARTSCPSNPNQNATAMINLRPTPFNLQYLPIDLQLTWDLGSGHGHPMFSRAMTTEIRSTHEFKDQLATYLGHIPNFHKFATELDPRLCEYGHKWCLVVNLKPDWDLEDGLCCCPSDWSSGPLLDGTSPFSCHARGHWLAILYLPSSL